MFTRLTALILLSALLGLPVFAATPDDEGLVMLEPLPGEWPAELGPPSGVPLRPWAEPAKAARKIVRRAVGPGLMEVPALPPAPQPRLVPDGPVGLTLAYPAAGSVLPEGAAVTLVWNSGGPIKSVRVTYEGELCALGGRGRGTFSQTITSGANRGLTNWRVPWMDAVAFKVKVVGLSDRGKELTRTEQAYQLLPLVCQRKPATSICVSKARQRLYYLSDGRIRRMHVISTAAPGYWTPVMRPGSYDHQRGAMGRVFYKAYAPVSRMYEVVMYHWLAITSSGSHGIHATSPPFYGRLGGPASHGCIRQHRADARVLWNMVSVGTPVYVM